MILIDNLSNKGYNANMFYSRMFALSIFFCVFYTSVISACDLDTTHRFYKMLQKQT